MDIQSLKIKGVIGFNGKVLNGLHNSPCGDYIVYPLGTFVVIKSLISDKEAFLDGHTNQVSCIAVSSDGRKIASGQANSTGTKADVLIWNFSKAKKLLDDGEVMIGEDCASHRLMQHRGKVQDIDFSCDDKYLCTLGGQDDNALVIWDVENGTSICGSPAATDSALCVKWVHNRNDRLVSAGNYHVRVWQVNYPGTKLHPMEAKLYKVRRQIISISITEDDNYAYCGTLTGDVIQLSILRDEIKTFKEPDVLTPEMKSISEHRFSKGVKSIYCVTNPSSGQTNILIGAGDGTVGMLNGNSLKKVAGYATKLLGAITSIAPIYNKSGSIWKFIIGTDQCNRYEVSPDLIDTILKASCHSGSVHDVCFPEGCADLVVTASVGDLRIWNVQSKMEILRIQVPNLECYCSAVTPSGRSIVSGWSDGKIRSFYPQSGKIQFVIPDAHTEQVTALAVADRDYGNEWRLISGGAEGRVRIWKITSQHQAMISSLKEHRAPIKNIKVNSDSSQAISASADGSCIIWDLNKYVRLHALFESNVFLSVLYHPDESQILTCGSNHKISYWDASDGEAIRVIDGGEKEINCLDITQNGEFFVSGSRDMMLKFWHYDNGITCCTGRGHSGNINAVKLSPDERIIVSVCSTGEIIFWEMPDLREIRSSLKD